MSGLRLASQVLCGLLVLAGGSGPARSVETITPIVSTAAEASHVLCTGPCSLRSFYATTGAAGGYVMTFNRVTAPADGAVSSLTPAFQVECVAVGPAATVALDFGGRAEAYNKGLTVVFSTTGCFSKTASATAFFKAQVQ